MKLLHTSDWHVGKTLRGVSRLEEQSRVLDEIVSIAAEETVDLVLVVGDVFETAVPPPEAQRVAWRALLDLKATGAEVIVVAGNHDNPHTFDALRPVFAGAGITMLGRPVRADEGGLVSFEVKGAPVNLALLPFCSQRSIVRTAELLAQDAAANAATYAERLAAILRSLMASFALPPDATKGKGRPTINDEAVNIVAAHAFVRGGRLGGGERDAQTIEDYWIDAGAFGSAPHYVALGHLHLTQQMAGGCPIWYSGSPIQVDFGEEGDDKHVLLVEAEPGVPISMPRRRRLHTPRRLRTLRGSIDELKEQAEAAGDDLLRVYVQAKARAGLADEIRDFLPNAVDVFVEQAEGGRPAEATRSSRVRSPRELFASYLEEQGVEDERLKALFARLLDEATSPAEQAV